MSGRVRDDSCHHDYSRNHESQGRPGCAAGDGQGAERALAGDRADVYSAGSEPGDQVHPEVAAVLESLGLNVGGETPKAFDPDGTYTAVITMGCGDACPFYAGAMYDDWALDDPRGQDPATVVRIVADIDGRVRRLLTDLLPDLALPPSVFEQAAT